MFTPILMTFAGDSDATREVAEEIAATLDEERLEAEVRPLHTVASLEGYGAVMVGGPITDGQWDEHAREFLRAHRSALIELPVAVFAVGPPSPDPDDIDTDRSELLAELSQLRWLHPIAADLFRGAHVPVRTSVRGSMNGHATLNGKAHAFDVDAVRTWARWVARVLHPSAR